MKLTYEEERILNFIKRWHSGRGRAITYKELASVLKINDRALRDVVAHLITEHGQLIATCSDSGYFYIQNDEEYSHARGEIISRIDKLRQRLDGLDEGWKENTKGQRALFEMEAS
jgi:hypothetical protein